MNMFYIPVILGGTRRGRQSPKVARFIAERMKRFERIETEILDLAEYDFPIMEERLRFRDDPPPGLREFGAVEDYTTFTKHHDLRVNQTQAILLFHEDRLSPPINARICRATADAGRTQALLS